MVPVDTMVEMNSAGAVYTSWSDVVAALNLQSGVMICTMESLRNIEGYERLGTQVRDNIARKLSTLGVAYIREELPTDATAKVLLYRQGTPVSELIQLIFTVQSGGMNNAEYIAESLRRLNVMPDPNTVREGIVQAVEGTMQVLSALDDGTYANIDHSSPLSNLIAERTGK